MRFHSRFYHTLPPTPDGRVLGELTLVQICDNNGGGASAYIRNCDDLEVAYHLFYERTDMSLDTTPQLTPVNLVRRDGSPALTGHYMVDLLPLSNSSETINRAISWEPLPHHFSTFRWNPWLFRTPPMEPPPA